MAASAARQRYRWLVLLVAAVLLLVWMFVPADQERPDAGSGADGSSSSSVQDPTGTSTDDTTTLPSTPPANDDPDSGLPVVRLDDLPPEAAETLELIDAGGPFPEDRDGVTFENREELLPDRPTGYYREYTVPTPGSDDRGARRIVAGGGGELFWTGDHYSSFSRIARQS